MFNLISLIVGIVTMIYLVLIFLVPLIGGIGSWPALLAGIVGAAIGQLGGSKTGRNFNILVILVALLRLSIGGGVL